MATLIVAKFLFVAGLAGMLYIVFSKLPELRAVEVASAARTGKRKDIRKFYLRIRGFFSVSKKTLSRKIKGFLFYSKKAIKELLSNKGVRLSDDYWKKIKQDKV